MTSAFLGMGLIRTPAGVDGRRARCRAMDSAAISGVRGSWARGPLCRAIVSHCRGLVNALPPAVTWPVTGGRYAAPEETQACARRRHWRVRKTRARWGTTRGRCQAANASPGPAAGRPREPGEVSPSGFEAATGADSRPSGSGLDLAGHAVFLSSSFRTTIRAGRRTSHSCHQSPSRTHQPFSP